MIRPISQLATSAILAVAFSGSAYAAVDPASQDGGITASEPASPFASSRIADEAALARATAREDLSIISETDQTSTVTNGTVTGTTNGEINFSDNAFQNATGLTVINANSGNNVAMNASLTVNVVMTTPQ